jgi:ABC-type multidrug transport system fused ATPase/permease subunit
MLAAFLVARSKLGRTLRGIRENEELAEAIGIHTLYYKILIFAISGLFAGWGGLLYGYHLRHIAPQLFGAFGSIQLVLMLLLGGSRTLWGPVVGAVIVFFLPEVLGLDPIQSRILYGALLILVILLLPRGLAHGIRQQYLRVRGFAGRGGISRAEFIEEPREPPTYDAVSVSRKIFAGTSADVSERTLTISDVKKRFGGLVALDGISIEIRPGELVGIIGPNGSGKTTLFNVICGVHQASAGEIIWGVRTSQECGDTLFRWPVLAGVSNERWCLMVSPSKRMCSLQLNTARAL